MLPTTIHASPSVSDYVPLSEYESTTPESFHGGKPVLHYHATSAKIWLPKDQQSKLPLFPADAPAFDGDSGEMISQDEITLFINSEYVVCTRILSFNLEVVALTKILELSQFSTPKLVLACKSPTPP